MLYNNPNTLIEFDRLDFVLFSIVAPLTKKKIGNPSWKQCFSCNNECTRFQIDLEFNLINYIIESKWIDQHGDQTSWM